MRRLVRVALIALTATGCTSVKIAQRDGCWVRRTEKAFGRVVEEIGPCVAPQPHWSQDPAVRLVQECVAQADFRAQARALEVFSRRLPYPTPQPGKDETVRACMEEVRGSMDAERNRAEMERKLAEVAGERDALKEDAARDRAKLFAEVAGERDALRQESGKDRARLQDRDDKLAEWLGRSHDKLADSLGRSQDKLAESLGQAAQKPPGNATATATSSSTSDGKATNDTGATLAADSGASAPPASAPVSNASVVVPASPPAPPAPAAARPAGATATPAQSAPALPRRAKTLRARRAPSPVRAVSADGCQRVPADGPAPTASAPPCAADGATPAAR